MADNQHAKLLLAELGKLVGISDLGFDETGRCALMIDDSLEISVAQVEGEDRLILAGLLGELPADTPLERYAMLLDANFFWRGTHGATLGVERESGTVILIESVPLGGLYAGDLEARLGRFVKTAQEWMDRLAGKAVGDERPTGPDGGEHLADPGHVIMRL